ncbi:MAG: pseudouridine synthase [Pseudomonadales bacterium]|nr:pseudouridine synthase [Pseudomonadales bacterium]
MAALILFNKPYGVISQFSASGDKVTLGTYIHEKGFYPAGRLDHDSEGLLLLTNDGKLQARIASPTFKLPKTYWVQVEGEITEAALMELRRGVTLKDGKTRPAQVRRIPYPGLPARTPPVRYRANIPDSWVAITITEGRNRQVRRMTAATGFPTLRLFRYAIGPWSTEGLPVGSSKLSEVNLPVR